MHIIFYIDPTAWIRRQLLTLIHHAIVTTARNHEKIRDGSDTPD